MGKRLVAALAAILMISGAPVAAQLGRPEASGSRFVREEYVRFYGSAGDVHVWLQGARRKDGMITHHAHTKQPLLELALMVRNQAQEPITVDVSAVELTLQDGTRLEAYPGYRSVMGWQMNAPHLIETDGEDVTVKRPDARSAVLDPGHMAVLSVTFAWDRPMLLTEALGRVAQVDVPVSGRERVEVPLRPVEEWVASAKGPTPEQVSARAARARELLQHSSELDKKVAELRSSGKKTPLREAVGYAVLYGEQAQKLLADLKDGGLDTPAQAAAEAALSSQVERLAALRAAYEFEEKYGKGPAAAKWAEVKTADQRYKQALQDAYRACSEAAAPAPATQPVPSKSTMKGH